jgi:hypothetical protein
MREIPRLAGIQCSLKQSWHTCCGKEIGSNSFSKEHEIPASVATLYSRKQFFGKALSQSLRALFRWIDQEEPGSGDPGAERSFDYRRIISDFPPTLLRQEAQRLGLEPDSFEREALLQAVYEAMDRQHQSVRNDGGDFS